MHHVQVILVGHIAFLPAIAFKGVNGHIAVVDERLHKRTLGGDMAEMIFEEDHLIAEVIDHNHILVKPVADQWNDPAIGFSGKVDRLKNCTLSKEEYP